MFPLACPQIFSYKFSTVHCCFSKTSLWNLFVSFFSFFGIKGNLIKSPSLSVPSGQFVVLNCSASVVCFICLSRLQWQQLDHSLLVTASSSSPYLLPMLCVGMEVLLLGCQLYPAFKGASLNFSETFSSVSLLVPSRSASKDSELLWKASPHSPA